MRRVHNTGNPVLSILGLPQPNTLISFTLLRASTRMPVSARRLDNILVKDTEHKYTDQNGEFWIDLYCNTEVQPDTCYGIKIADEPIRYATLFPGEPIQLIDLLTFDEALPLQENNMFLEHIADSFKHPIPRRFDFTNQTLILLIHNLGYEPQTQVFNSSGYEIYPELKHTNNMRLEIASSEPITGYLLYR